MKQITSYQIESCKVKVISEQHLDSRLPAVEREGVDCRHRSDVRVHVAVDGRRPRRSSHQSEKLQVIEVIEVILII